MIRTQTGQFATWMLLNLLARCSGSVRDVALSCPDVPLLPGAVPGRDVFGSFADAACADANEIQERPVAWQRDDQPAADIAISIGQSTNSVCNIEVVFGNWWGGVISDPASTSARTDPNGMPRLPFGALLGVAFAAGEVFRRTRIPDAEPLQTFAYDMWTHTTVADLALLEGRDEWVPSSVHVDAALAGVGAVGTAWLAALWATPGLVGQVLFADGDFIEDTNLNRCVLFTKQSIGRQKVAEAKRRMASPINDISWAEFDGTVQTSTAAQAPIELLVSAVDKNRSRRALQMMNPRRILAASTHNLRVDVLRPGPPRSGACLSCHNPLEPETSDNELRSRYRAASTEQRAAIAGQLNQTVETLDAWADQAGCGELDARALPVLAASLASGPRQFSIGHLSVIAGTLLAAETVLECAQAGGGLSETANRVSIQTVSPWWIRNRVSQLGIDSECTVCNDETRLAAWLRRYVPRLANLGDARSA